MSLRWRIALGMAAIAALVSALGAGAAYLSTERQLRDTFDQSLLARARDLAATPGGFERGGDGTNRDPDGAFGPSQCPPTGLLEPANVAQVVTSQGEIVNCLEGGRTIPADAAALAAARSSPGVARLATVDHRGTYRVVTVARRDGTVLQLGRDLDEIDDVLGSLGIRLVLLAGAGVVLAAILGWVLATRIVAPITRLRGAAERIARTGELDAELPAGGTDEVGSLATSFATMVDALADSRRRQQQLVADASHELRTPLTSLQTNAELLERSERLNDDQRRQVSEGIRFEVGELTDLVSELVTLAREPGADHEAEEPVVLAELASAAVEAARLRTDREITLAVTDAAATVPGRPRAIGRAIANLLDNAVKYGAGPIDVVVDGTSVEVGDRGPGIPEADLPHVFDRFYRADAARTETGSGLGLAIVAQVVERHGGAVSARNRPGGGAVVGFTLPR